MLITLIGIGCAVFVRGGLERRQAVEALCAAGGEIQFDGREPSLLQKARRAILGRDGATDVSGVDLRDGNVGDEIFASLVRLPEMTSLGLEKSRVTDRGFATIGALGNLRYLILTDVPISDAAAAHICPRYFT